MNSEVYDLYTDIKSLEYKLECKKQALNNIITKCNHQWGRLVDCSEYKPAYIIPGDPPGVGGVDHRLPVHVPAQTILKWSRTCTCCRFTQYTDKVDAVVTHVPNFR